MQLIFNKPDHEDLQKLLSEGKIKVVQYQIPPEDIESLVNDGYISIADGKATLNYDVDELYRMGKLKPATYDLSDLPNDIISDLMLKDIVTARVKDKNDEWVIYNPAKERDPRLPHNENGGSKEDSMARYHLQFHPRGIYYQSKIKQTFEKLLKLVHFVIVSLDYKPRGFFFNRVIIPISEKLATFVHVETYENYDSDAYKFDDPRLKTLNTFCRTYMSMYFDDDEGIPGRTRKLELSNICIDIPIHLCKEDIYYRARMFDFCKKLRELPDWVFELDELERENIRLWSQNNG